MPGNEMPNILTEGFGIRSRQDGGYTIASGDVAEHYISPKSFKDHIKSADECAAARETFFRPDLIAIVVLFDRRCVGR